MKIINDKSVNEKQLFINKILLKYLKWDIISDT